MLSRHGELGDCVRPWHNRLTVSDTYLNTVISSLSTDKYTVIYTTSPDTSAPFHQNDQDHGQYQMDEPYPSGMHTDLKRDLNVQQTSSNSSNLNSNLPLFERYRFVNSGKTRETDHANVNERLC